MTNCTLGIDGGGSNLRVAVVDEQLKVLAQTTHGTANPSAIGRDASAALIQEAIREVIALTGSNVSIYAVGIGIAGAAATHSAEWLRQTVKTVLPDIQVAASMDYEIALVGAHGKRRGLLILAGTGTVGYGVNDAGESAQVGGWGYLLGDEGGGYWIGLQALKALTRWADNADLITQKLAQSVMEHLQFTHPTDVLKWIYAPPPPIREVAALAEIVLNLAEEGDALALEIIEKAADALAGIAHILQARLGLHDETQIAFAGGLLTAENRLSQALCKRLSLTAIPQPRYTPVIGAALLAQLTFPNPED